MSGIKIVIVDDEQGIREALSKRLGHRGLEVRQACGGQEALDLLKSFEADLVLLDVKMPGMNGFETLQRIKAFDPLIEVILLTGHADLNSSVQCLECGAFAYLLKPVEIDLLLFKIEDAYEFRTLQRNNAKYRFDSTAVTDSEPPRS